MGQAPAAHGKQLNVPDLVVMDKYLSNFARMARIFIIFNNPILGQLILTQSPIEKLDHWALAAGNGVATTLVSSSLRTKSS